mmetsp:Transcript_7572/g.20511  ORF Transcript_7572/g.20511 Transcript_7572/m.20511 type:complete len:86 (+) Transcript_7572:513-770(+)
MGAESGVTMSDAETSQNMDRLLPERNPGGKFSCSQGAATRMPAMLTMLRTANGAAPGPHTVCTLFKRNILREPSINDENCTKDLL